MHEGFLSRQERLRRNEMLGTWPRGIIDFCSEERVLSSLALC